IEAACLGWVSVTSAEQLTPLWAVEYPSSATEAAVDRAGNSYFASSDYFPTGGMSVVKITPAGRQAWVSYLSLSGWLSKLSVDSRGDVYVAGQVVNAPGSTNLDLATAKFGADGHLLWQAQYDPPDHTLDYVNGIGSDSEGNVYVAGRSYSYAIAAAYHTLLKYDFSGHLLWARRFEGSTNSTPHNTGSMAVNPLGGAAVVSSRAIASYSAEGDLLWSWQGGTSELVAFDSGGNLFTSLLIAPTVLRLLKFSPCGDVLWTADYVAPLRIANFEQDLKVDALGNIYVATGSAVECHFDNDNEPELICHYLPTVVKFSPNGQQLWASRFAVPNNFYSELRGLALDNSGNAYITANIVSDDELTK